MLKKRGQGDLVKRGDGPHSHDTPEPTTSRPMFAVLRLQRSRSVGKLIDSGPYASGNDRRNCKEV
jgi:hypothetical protein